MGTEKDTEKRVLYLRVAPYLDRRQIHDLETDPIEFLLKDLRGKHLYEVSLCPGTPRKPTRHRCLDSEEQWQLRAEVADRPGMVARVLTSLALIRMRVLNITIKQVPRKEGSSAGSRHKVMVVFYRPRKRNYKENPDLPDSEPELAIDFVAAELTSIPGFYSVTLQRQRKRRIPSGKHVRRLSAEKTSPTNRPPK